MTFETIIKALDKMLPNSRYFLHGDNYEDIEWFDDRPLPSEEVLENTISSILIFEIKQKRIKEIIDELDYLDTKAVRHIITNNQTEIDNINKIKQDLLDEESILKQEIEVLNE